jgi:hypothetical protein
MTTPTPPIPTPRVDAAYLETLQWAARHGHEKSVEQKLLTMEADPRPASAWQVARALELECAGLRAALKPFAEVFDGDLGQIGGGTLVSPQLKAQLFKDAKRALNPTPGGTGE